MASDEGPQSDAAGPAYERAPEMPDRGIPGHFGHEKQLHSATGYNVVVDAQGGVYGTREPYNSEGRAGFLVWGETAWVRWGCFVFGVWKELNVIV